MTSFYYHFWRFTNAVYKVKLRIITVSVPFFNSNTDLNDFTEEFVNRIREKKKDAQKASILEIKFKTSHMGIC